MTLFREGDEQIERQAGECTSVVVYNPQVFDLSIEVEEEPPEPKIYELPENSLAFQELIRMHSYKRPHGSKTERKFIRDYITPLGADKVKIDKFGNRIVRIGDAPIMWSCHVDTVHNRKGHQDIGYDGDEIGVASTDPSNCLGADDTAGVWLMLQMIRAGRPGLYIFHRGEEVGCLGSKYITQKTKDLVTGIKFAIALDRKGMTDVITHQRSSRTCSDVFAKSVADELGMGYKPASGVYTDTAEYTDLIGECTNLSVGYRDAHQRVERLDLNHIFKLRDVLLKFDWEKLVAKREPGEREVYQYNGGSNTGGYYGSSTYNYNREYDDEFDEKLYGNSRAHVTGGHWENGRWIPDKSTSYSGGNSHTANPSGMSWLDKQKAREQAEADRRAARLAKGSDNPYNDPKNAGKSYGMLNDDDVETDDDDDNDGESNGPYDYDRMVALVKSNPEAIADILEQFGMGPRQLAHEILDAVGICNH